MPAPHRPQPDPYQLLGVAADATRTDIVRAYRRIARTLHPDSRPAQPDAAEQLHAITLAYDLLSDPAQRAAYDRQHPGRSSQPRPPAAASTGPHVPPLWPLDHGPAGPPGAAPRTAPPGPALWAGPVIIEPASGEPTTDLADLARRFLTRRTGQP
jgi:curved DNA-binding protein CbpA